MINNLSPIGSIIKPPINTNLQELPFEDLPWETFEELCLKLVQTEFSINVCERRGIQGQNQQGIDIFARHDDGKFSVYQCKKYRKFSKTDLNKVISEFTKGEYFIKSKRFFICTACELRTNQIQIAFEVHKANLEKNNIELVKWDKKQLSIILKQFSQIVYDIFGTDWVKAFNGEKALSEIFNIPEAKIYNNLKIASSDLFSINNNFTNLKNSHIERKETTELENWIYKKLDEKETNIAVLAGNAGTGKTVILKDLIDLLSENNTPVLGLKADKKQINFNELGKSILDIDANIHSIFEKLLLKHKVVVVIVDQIDALSRSLSTNRQQIKAYGSLISQLSIHNRVRIIISSRIFDLNHDPELKLFTNKKVIKLSLLSEHEVGVILRRLSNKELKSFPKDLILLLQTPLHLDVFCKIYNESTSLNEIKSLQDLYRNLWNLKIKELPLDMNFSPITLEIVLYKIANEIHERQENLSIPIQVFDRYYDEINYLKSENLIVEDHGNMQFFHQSFYDYTYARNFVEEKGGNIFSFLLKQKHQGLFIRAITKQVLAYLRFYNPNLYIDQLKKIIFSNEIRYHIKLLIVEQLAFEENPKLEEFKLVQSIFKYNNNLGLSFINSILGIMWFNYFNKKKEILIELYKNGDSTAKNIIARYIVFSANNNIEAAFNMLSQIDDKDEKANLYKWALFRTPDFSKSIVTDTYFTIEKDYIKSDSERLQILSNAIKSKPDFAINESRKIFHRILNDWNKKRKRELGHHSDESEFYDFCESLHKEVPEKAYSFLKEIIISLIDKTIIDHSYHELNILKEDFAFQNYQPDTFLHHKLLDWVLVSLNKTVNEDLKFVKKELKVFFNSNQASLFYIGLQLMLSNPSKFLDEIFSISIDRKLVEDFLQINDLKYFFRELINTSYSLFSFEQRSAFNNFILSYFPKKDFYFDKEYKIKREKNGMLNNNYYYPYPFLGYDQWILLNSIPIDMIKQNESLRNRLYMFNRRYSGWKCENEKPNHHVVMASFQGGLMSIENYEKLSDTQWLHSFEKLENKDFRYSLNRNFSVEEHAHSFKEVVKRNPEKYISFFEKIITENKVNIRYQVLGLEGLIEGEYDVHKIRVLYGDLMKRQIPDTYLYTFIRESKYFIKNSTVDRELINFWKKQLERPFEPKNREYIVDNEVEKNDILFSQGLNSINSDAIELIIQLSDLESYREEVHQYLLSICNSLPIQLKLVVLYRLNNGCAFEIEQLLRLFQAYTKEASSEVYHVAPNIINRLFFENFERLIPFVKQTISIPAAAKSLGVYLLYGWFYGFEKSKELLLELHQTHPVSIGESIGEACRYLHNSEFKEKCLFILDLYAKDKTKTVRESYSHGFYQLKSDDLPLILKIIEQYISEIDEERLYSLYHYLTNCTKDYPIECINIIHAIDFNRTLKNVYEIEDPLKLLMLSYNAIREYDITDENLEFAMDVFDELLQQVSSKTEIDKILKELDFE